MKSLSESLFDDDLTTKEITFGSKWELIDLTNGLGDYYNFYADTDTEHELVKKAFKTNKLKGKPMVDTDPSVWQSIRPPYIEDMDFWGDFLRIIKILENLSWIPEYTPFNKGIIPPEIEKELKKYIVTTGGLEMKFYTYSNRNGYFVIKKSFGAKNKWIFFGARFREKQQ